MIELNKICSLSDWNDPELKSALKMLMNLPPNIQHRKHWEWAMGVLSLQKLGMLKPDSLALGIGCGGEQMPFFLSNYLGYVFCTDLYGISPRDEARPSMLTDPQPPDTSYRFNRRRLGVQVMDGTDIQFEDNTFDIVFSYSSIEHFGSKEAAMKSMREIERVLKPWGVASIATEAFIGSNYDVLNRERALGYSILSEIFTPEEIDKYLLHSTGLQATNEVNYDADARDLQTTIKFPEEIERLPHIILEYKGVRWTSIHLALIKEPDLSLNTTSPLQSGYLESALKGMTDRIRSIKTQMSNSLARAMQASL